MPTYDAIVLGCGGVGSAALYHLARRGLRVLGIDQFAPPHDRGSSHGHTRIIRRGYFEHPNYVPLVEKAYKQWHRLQADSGRLLYHQTGLVQIGPPAGYVIRGIEASARQHKLAIERFTPEQTARCWPQFHVPEGTAALYEHDAGCLLVEECVQAHLDLALRHGAELRKHCKVSAWRALKNNVVVTTSREEIHASRLIVAAGPWAGRLLRDLSIPLTVLRKPQFWYASGDDTFHADRRSPCFLLEIDSGIFYGFPQLDSRGVKLAEHSGGEEITDPQNVARELRPRDQKAVDLFRRAHLPRLGNMLIDHSICFYTMTPDGHFVVDHHPEFPQVVFAAGLSGHGFKFTGVLGAALADLAIDGSTDHPIGFLSLHRWHT